MVRNWSFTLFYCAAELWGDVALSLLFWGLANELTNIDEAPMLYPLFGVGANVGQTLAGKMLSMFSGSSNNALSQTQQLQVRTPHEEDISSLSLCASCSAEICCSLALWLSAKP